MMMIDEHTKAELIREIATTLAKKQRLAFASDFHALAEGRTLILAGVAFENFPKGPNTRRSDGDVVAHAIVMALAGATNTGDIDDWFPDKGETGVSSMAYLPEMRHRLVEARQLVIGTIDVTILCGEQPRMKKRTADMQRNIAEGLAISPDQVHVKVSSMDGEDEIAQLKGIEARVLISLWENLQSRANDEKGESVMATESSLLTWAEEQARSLLSPLGNRWLHTKGVVERAQEVGKAFNEEDRVLLMAAAYLHDIGYAPSLHRMDFHPLDGAHYLLAHKQYRLASLVAYHSEAQYEAHLRDLTTELDKIPPEHSAIADALTYCDMTTGTTGSPISFKERLTDIFQRYDETHIVNQAIHQALPSLSLSIKHTQDRLDPCQPLYSLKWLAI